MIAVFDSFFCHKRIRLISLFLLVTLCFPLNASDCDDLSEILRFQQKLSQDSFRKILRRQAKNLLNFSKDNTDFSRRLAALKAVPYYISGHLIKGQQYVDLLVYASWVEQNPDRPSLPIEEIKTVPGFSELDVVRRLYSPEEAELSAKYSGKVPIVPTKRSEVIIPSLKGLSSKEVPSRETLSKIVDEIIALQFHGDEKTFTQTDFFSYEYVGPGGEHFSGAEIVYWFDLVDSLKDPAYIKKNTLYDGTVQAPPLSSMLGTGRLKFRFSEIKRERLPKKTIQRKPKLIMALVPYQERIKALENVYKEHIKDAPTVNVEAFLDLNTIIQGQSVKVREIFREFAREQLEATKSPSFRIANVDKHPEFGAEVWAQKYLVDKGKSVSSYRSPLNKEELLAFIKSKGIEDIVFRFADDPELLSEILNLSRPDIFPNNSSFQFVKDYVGLKINNPGSSSSKLGQNRETRLEKQKHYIAALMDSLNNLQSFNAEQSARHSNLIKRMYRFDFQLDPVGTIQVLRSAATDAAKDPRLVSSTAKVFITRIYEQAANEFEADLHFDLKQMKTPSFPYQKEGARFLVNHKRAILADEAGLGKTYQAIAAAQQVGSKKVIWITNASNRRSVQEEITRHTDTPNEQIVVLEAGNPAYRRKQIQDRAHGKYFITSYETLVEMKKSDKKSYDALISNADTLIVDEAQTIDNPKTLRSSAITNISAERIWLLTASPWQNRPQALFTLLNFLKPKEYQDAKLFSDLYLQDAAGLARLHRALDDVMLRRSKEDTVEYFESPEKVPFEQQLADGKARIPKKNRIDPDVIGKYELSEAQSKAIEHIIVDFRGWATEFNRSLPAGAQPIDLKDINPLTKFDIIHRVIYTPHRLGIPGENPLFKSLDKSVNERIARGEKIILWGWHTDVLNQLQERYGKHGVARIDGEVLGDARDKARNDFQNNPNTKILVANYKSGGVGLTLTAANASIFVEMPLSFSALYQAEGRHQRVIGATQAHHAKESVEVEWQVPIYPKNFVETRSTKFSRDTLGHGTLVEQTVQRLEGGRQIYDLVMSGVRDPADLDMYFKNGIISGLVESGPTRIGLIVPENKQNLAHTADVLRHLWASVKGDSEVEAQVLDLVYNLQFYPQVVSAFSGCTQPNCLKLFVKDLKLFNSLFNFKNKYIREKLLSHMPKIAVDLYAQGKALVDVLPSEWGPRLSPSQVLGGLVYKNGTSPHISSIGTQLARMPDNPSTRKLEERFSTGILEIHSSPVENIFDEYTEFKKLNLVEQIDSVYRAGLLYRLSPESLKTGLSDKIASGIKMNVAMEQLLVEHLAKFSERSPAQVSAALLKNPEWSEGVDRLSALQMRWLESGNPKLLAQFKEGLQHEIDGTTAQFRFYGGKKGNRIDYLADDWGFWSAIAENTQIKMKPGIKEQEKRSYSLFKAFDAIKRHVFTHQSANEAEQRLKAELRDYSGMDFGEKKETRSKLKESILALGKYLAQQNAELPQNIQTKYQMTEKPEKEIVLAKKRELETLQQWIELNEDFERLKVNVEPENFTKTLDMLSRREQQARRTGDDSLADSFDDLWRRVKSFKEHDGNTKEVTVYESDDPAMFSKMGCPTVGVSNCFNPNGNPQYNQYVMGAWGSKNTKMIVVKDDQGNILSTALYKVKKLEGSNDPVLFLERPLSSGSYDYRDEMLSLLFSKVPRIESEIRRKRPVIVMEEITGKYNDQDRFVVGTGAYTDFEYVEPVWGLRRQNGVKHRGRIFSGPKEPLQLELGLGSASTRLSGIGTSNKSIDAYVQELKEKNVKVVVDVRALPRSRFYPHFNKDRLQQSLLASGIKYIWLGDKLGNPPDATGQRSLSGFQEYMKSPAYQEGVKELKRVMDENDGNVALTCAEKAHDDCHRKFILEDLQKAK